MSNINKLTKDTTGRWLVTTQGTQHIWDLDAMTYTRLPSADSRAGSFDYDGQAQRITHVEMWPEIGEQSIVWYDDPAFPEAMEQYRVSSTIKTIEEITS